jgi:hypothetical protein
MKDVILAFWNQYIWNCIKKEGSSCEQNVCLLIRKVPLLMLPFPRISVLMFSSCMIQYLHPHQVTRYGTSTDISETVLVIPRITETFECWDLCTEDIMRSVSLIM